MKRTDYTLEIRWTVSRGRETEGWNICTLQDTWDSKSKHKTCGGGYDMQGTVFAKWLEANFLDRIKAACKPISYDLHDEEYRKQNSDGSCSYGFFTRNGKYWLDGACGFDCMRTIAKMAGLEVKTHWNERKKITDFIFVTDTLREEQ